MSAMMSVRRSVWAVALYGAAAVNALCTANLQIDNFLLFPNGNAMGAQASGKPALRQRTLELAD